MKRLGLAPGVEPLRKLSGRAEAEGLIETPRVRIAEELEEQGVLTPAR